jgi:hypothetical protein
MEHTWTILEEKILPLHLGEEQVIKTIWFRLTTSNETRSVSTDGRINLYTDELVDFVKYPQVDMQLRTTWIKAHAGDFYENVNIERLNQEI